MNVMNTLLEVLFRDRVSYFSSVKKKFQILSFKMFFYHSKTYFLAICINILYGTLMNRQNRFGKLFRFREDIRQQSAKNSTPRIVSQYRVENFYILFQGKERPAKTKCVTAKLRAVLVIAESHSAQCQSAQCPTPRSVSHFWIFGKCHLLTPRSVSQRGIRLHAVLVNFGFLKYFRK